MDHAQASRRTIPAGMELTAWSAPDGWRHRLMRWPQADGTRKRGSLLWAGGRGDFLEKYLETFADWHGRGWEVSSFDWRGQGRSRRGAATEEPFETMAADLALLIARWRAAGEGPYVAVAHSMGAHLLLRLLVERSPELDAVVLVAPMIAVNSGPLPGAAAALVAAGARRIGMAGRPLWAAPLARAPAGSKRQRALTGCVERYEDEAWWWAQEDGYAPVPPTFGWIDAAYRSARAFTPAALARIDVPVLLIGASGDRLVDPRAIRRTARLLPRSELMMIDDSAHEILREREEVRAAALLRIDAFLDRHAPAPGASR